MITVMGATGHTGKKITEELLDAGEKVRALGRSESKLAELEGAGAEVLAGDATDAAFLAEAFRGADAVYTLLPTDPSAPDYRAEQDRQGEAIAGAVRESGVPHVVASSSLGAELSEGTGVIAGLHAQEERLKRLDGRNVLLLRPVSFFENFYGTLGLIEHEGLNGGSVAPDLAVPMVATRDIAAAAAQALRARDWKGVVVRELLGPRDLSYAEATRIIGERIGKPDLLYVQFSYDDSDARRTPRPETDLAIQDHKRDCRGSLYQPADGRIPPREHHPKTRTARQPLADALCPPAPFRTRTRVSVATPKDRLPAAIIRSST